VATTHPPQLNFTSTCDGEVPVEAGTFRYNPTTRVLSGRVRIWNRTRIARKDQVAFVDFLADDDGDKRFEPQVSTVTSVITPLGRRGFFHGHVEAGRGAWARWAFVVPRGVSGRAHRLRGAGWIDAEPDPAVWVELEELAAASAEGQRDRGGWQWLHRGDEHSGWGVLHVGHAKHRRDLSRELHLPASGKYRVMLVGGRSPPRGVELRLGGLAVKVGETRRLDRGLYALGTVALGRRARLSLRHTRRRGVTLDALLLVPDRSGRAGDFRHHNLPAALPPWVLAGRRAARELLPRYLDERLRRTPRPGPVTSAEAWKSRSHALRLALRRTLDLPPHAPDAPPPRVHHLGSVKQGKLVVERLFIEGSAGLWASALLYRPAHSTGRLPAVLHALGHYGRGKLYRPALIFDSNLASRGFVVLAVDAVGLGERVVGKEDHHFHGLLHWLVGRSTTREMVGEMIRFVDYLRSRPDVDPQRIGMTGSSGGGTLTLYTAAVDPRIAAASCLAAVADWKWLFRFIGGDPEMYPRDVVRLADYATLLRLAAPRPMLVGVGRKDDMFPPRPARRAVHRARDAYRILGFPERLGLFVDKDPHGLKPGRRRATYRFFLKHLTSQSPAQLAEQPEDISLALFGVTTGRPPVTRSLVDGAREAARDLPPPLDPGDTGDSARSALARRRRALATVLAHPLETNPRSTFWTTGGWLAGNKRAERVTLRPEPGVRLPALWIHARGAPRATIIYVSDAGRPSAVHAVSLSEAGYDVLVVDLLGLGETTPNRRYRYGLGRPGPLYMQDFFGVALLNVLGGSLFALRVAHLGVLARWLARRSPQPVGVLGQGTECGVYALTAAALEPTLAGAAALGPLRSFKREIALARFPAPGLVAYGILRVADLPQLIALVAPRPVLLLGGRASDGTRERISPRADYGVPRAFYKRLGQPSRLVVGTVLSDPQKLLLSWAKSLSSTPRGSPAR